MNASSVSVKENGVTAITGHVIDGDCVGSGVNSGRITRPDNIPKSSIIASWFSSRIARPDRLRVGQNRTESIAAAFFAGVIAGYLGYPKFGLSGGLNVCQLSAAL